MSERSPDGLYWNPWTLRLEPDELLSLDATEVSSRWDAAERARLDEQLGATPPPRVSGRPRRWPGSQWSAFRNPRLLHPELGERLCLSCLDARSVPDARAHARHRSYDPGHLPRLWRVTKTTRSDALPVGTHARLVAWRIRVSPYGWRTSTWLLTAIDGPLAGSSFLAVRTAKRADADGMVTPLFLETDSASPDE
jgi:hypothetical protein